MALLRSLLVGLIFLTFAAPAQSGQNLLVFAPASMTDVMGELKSRFEKQSDVKVVFSFAGTGQLARQIEAGAPADLVITADLAWMKWMASRSLIDVTSQETIASNKLVVAVRNETENWLDVKGLLTGSRFAMGEPEAVPAGHYARAALESLGLWKEAKNQAVFGENVRLALRRLELGEVAAAIVYASDLRLAPSVRAAWTFQEKDHGSIQYEAALVNRLDRHMSADHFLGFLKSATAGKVFSKAGFAAVSHRSE